MILMIWMHNLLFIFIWVKQCVYMVSSIFIFSYLYGINLAVAEH